MRWWLDKGVDGFRMDVINFISKAPGYPEGQPLDDGQYTDGSPYFINGPRIHEYLQEMNEKVLRHYNIVTVGECPGKIKTRRKFLRFNLNLIILKVLVYVMLNYLVLHNEKN